MEATEPLTFAVNFPYNDFPAFRCENGIGEQLCGARNENGEKFEGKPFIDSRGIGFLKLNQFFAVFRHQANAEAGDQLRQWVDGNTEKGGVLHTQCIRLSRPIIGLPILCFLFLNPNFRDGYIFAMPDLDEEEANDEGRC